MGRRFVLILGGRNPVNNKLAYSRLYDHSWHMVDLYHISEIHLCMSDLENWPGPLPGIVSVDLVLLFSSDFGRWYRLVSFMLFPHVWSWYPICLCYSCERAGIQARSVFGRHLASSSRNYSIQVDERSCHGEWRVRPRSCEKRYRHSDICI